MPASAGGHYRGHCRRDIVGEQDKVREEQIPEQRHMVSRVLLGVTACGTETLPRATLRNTARGVTVRFNI
ncbi:unnamed protein product [Staurois parvus]|uniref:Uncharacterized protein n=1 Tax=Staurois parvus TaxID=386267 RepID=A0ABN9D6Q6_9NEOB|nr:unnamed protein product [Staurois parvus]